MIKKALKGKRLNYNAALQSRYKAALRKLIDKMTEDVKKQIIELFKDTTADDFFEEQKEAAAMDANISSQARILMNMLIKKYNRFFALKSKTLAERMVKESEKISKNTLQLSLKEISKGFSLTRNVIPKGMEEVATALVAENVSLIKSIPEQYLKNVTGAVMRSITTGNGIKDLIPEVNKYQKQTYRRAKNLALDQTRKAYNSINKQRMQTVGVKQFEWIHSGGGQHPRKSHIALSGKIFDFDNLPVINKEQVDKGYESPQKGIPGQAINCKCTMLPVIKFEE